MRGIGVKIRNWSEQILCARREEATVGFAVRHLAHVARTKNVGFACPFIGLSLRVNERPRYWY